MESQKGSTSQAGSGPQKQGSMPSTTENSGTTQSRFDVISARYRAAWPKLLSRRGVEMGKNPLPSFIVPHVSTIEEKAREILSRHQIKFEDEDEVEVQLLDQSYDYTEHFPTLLITAPWSVDKQEDWKNAVRDMVQVIYTISQEAKFDQENVLVEMKDPILTKKICIWPVESWLHYNAEWDAIRKLVRQRLKAFKATRGEVAGIQLLRYGVVRRREANPVTNSIGCYADSDETGWLEVIDDIRMNIDEHGWTDVYIHIEHRWNEW
ncbi:uncharacterized protein FIESC28_01622 [Fusarium coffeatum]|uniref:Uncharacterized protein n=1 Tax=Fusarium coffeatum TaxID=231269 RepID=A0A366S8P0_9HYPO|nr:uncharacterized protein FIESC28_01622 [Fusarium coffeatum]RBR25659.1 hypothetical protein FIESC28_01622 [Fusarium coffeatum]